MILGMLLKNYKIYSQLNYIPISNNHKFCAYIGDNGTGKSTILEALDVFFNDKEFNRSHITKGASATGANTPHITIISLLDKNIVKNILHNEQTYLENIEKISNFLWDFDGTLDKEQLFEDLKSINPNLQSTHYLCISGIGYGHNRDEVFFSSFDGYISELFGEKIDSQDRKENQEKNKKIRLNFKFINDLVKEYYSYVYIPVEIGIEEFTKLETDNMQRLIGKNLWDVISEAVTTDTLNKINRDANNFINQLTTNIDNGRYEYRSSDERNRQVRLYDLVNVVIDNFFSIRQLWCDIGGKKIPVNNLSSGEKRQALIDIATSLLNSQTIQNKEIILAIDEPEASLHISKQFLQFEKLINLSKNKIQVLITTHWYGFLPIVVGGMAHFLEKNITDTDKIDIRFQNFDLYNYKEQLRHIDNELMPSDISLKSDNDLVQSIIASIRLNEPYNWLICEGISDKIYFEFYFNDIIEKFNLRILPIGGFKYVLKLYEYLELPLKNDKKDIKGKIYCLIDTDRQPYNNFRHNGEFENSKIMIARRLFNDKNNIMTILEKINSGNMDNVTDIEDCLNSKIFIETLKIFNNNTINQLLQDYENNINYEKNSYFCFDLRESERKILKDFFDENNGYRKIEFAEKYVEIAQSEENHQVPNFISEIKKWFE